MSETTGEVRLDNPETAADAVARAEALARTDWAGAIALLESANHASRSDEVEIALAALRHRAYSRLAATAPDRAPAPPGQTPPVGESGLPEAPLAGLTAGAVRAALLEHGCLLVRGVLDARHASEIAGGSTAPSTRRTRRTTPRARLRCPGRHGGPHSRSTPRKRPPSAGSG